jgi:adenylate kinase family enzyme
MVVLTIKPIEPVNGLAHISTYWQIASDKIFNYLVDEGTTTAEQKHIYISNEELIPNAVYYSRVKRILSDGSNSGWGEIVLLKNNITPEPVSGLMDIFIDTPIISVVKESIIATNSMLEIKTSTFKGKNANHEETHWIITDDNNEVCFSSIGSRYNLTHIMVDKYSNNLLDKNSLTIMAIHKAGNVESKIGKLVLSLGDFNFNIITNTQKVLPNTDLNIEISKVVPEAVTNIKSIVLLDPATNEIIFREYITTDKLDFVIPGILLYPNSIYYLVFYVIGDGGTFNTKRKLISTIDNYVNYVGSDYKYRKSYSERKLVGSLIPQTAPLKQFYTHEFVNGDILIPDSGLGGIYKYKYNRKTKALVRSTRVEGLALAYGNAEIDHINTLIKMFNNNYVVIDNEITTVSSRYPIFSVYKYNPNFNSYELLHTSLRSEEKTAIGYNNSYVEFNKDSILYIPAFSNIIAKFNYVSNVREYLSTTPLSIPQSGNNKGNIIFKVTDSLYVVLGGDNSYAYYYNTITNLYSKAFTIPQEFRGYSLRQHTLINGDVVITVIGELDYRYMLYFSIFDNKMSVIETAECIGTQFNNTIQLATGELLFLNTSGADSTYGLFE